jgi:sulfur-oxidizing protein SoxZ
MATRALLTLPNQARAGDVIDLRLLVQHPMETGLRVAADGRVVARDLVRRVECRLDGELVFAADLHAAVAANPYLSFKLRVQRSGTVVVTWVGDRGFAHSETAALVVT